MKIASKWIKHRVLVQDSLIRAHLPQTRLLSGHTLWSMLRRHRTVYLKPVIGTGGHGIFRIRWLGNTSYLLQKEMKQYSLRGKVALLRLIRRLTGSRKYLVQQGIDLLSIKQRPLDYRLLMLRPSDRWKLIGTMGKWAAPGKIVTNHCRGGKPIGLCLSLQRSLNCSAARCQQIEQAINQLGQRIAKTLGDRYHMRQLGIDLGIDKQLRIWILEVNTDPRYQLFRYHQDRSLYPKIVHYMKKIKSHG